MSVDKYAKKLAKHLPALGDQGVDALAKELDDQANNADAPWKKALLNLAADSIEKHGPEGVRMASQAIEDLFDGKRGTKISDLTDDLETASDLLGALQSAEASRKSAARNFMRGLGQTLGTVTKGFIKALL